MHTEIRRVEIINPGLPRTAKSGPVTDRALRYRANQKAVRPEGPRLCYACGKQRNIDIDHVDGREENTNPENLIYLCRSCNTTKGAHFARAGAGRLTNQYNPAGSSSGARSMGQWVNALMVLKGHSDSMPLSRAIAMVHATPASRRSEFAQEIWRRRRARGTDTEVPF